MVARVGHGKFSTASTLPAGVARPRSSPAYTSWDCTSSLLVRVHDQCATSEVFGSLKCDCKQQLESSLLSLSAACRASYAALHGVGGLPRCDSKASTLSSSHAATASDDDAEDGVSIDHPPAAAQGSSAPVAAAQGGSSGGVDDSTLVGVVIYLMQEGRGIGISAKIAAYALQEGGAGHEALDTVDANRALGLPDDAREYTAARDILQDLEGGRDRDITLMTNNPRKVELLTSLGLRIAARVPCHVTPTSPLAAAYMRTKALRMGHDIPASLYAAAAGVEEAEVNEGAAAR